MRKCTEHHEHDTSTSILDYKVVAEYQYKIRIRFITAQYPVPLRE